MNMSATFANVNDVNAAILQQFETLTADTEKYKQELEDAFRRCQMCGKCLSCNALQILAGEMQVTERKIQALNQIIENPESHGLPKPPRSFPGQDYEAPMKVKEPVKEPVEVKELAMEVKDEAMDGQAADAAAYAFVAWDENRNIEHHANLRSGDTVQIGGVAYQFEVRDGVRLRNPINNTCYRLPKTSSYHVLEIDEDSSVFVYYEPRKPMSVIEMQAVPEVHLPPPSGVQDMSFMSASSSALFVPPAAMRVIAEYDVFVFDDSGKATELFVGIIDFELDDGTLDDGTYYVEPAPGGGVCFSDDNSRSAVLTTGFNVVKLPEGPSYVLILPHVPEGQAVTLEKEAKEDSKKRKRAADGPPSSKRRCR
jgi:hypothetical protein